MFNNIYNENKINEFKNDFYSTLNEYANSENKKKYKIKELTFNIINQYIRPLIPRDNVIGKFFDSVWVYNENIKSYSEEMNFIGSFYEKYKDKYINIDNKKLKLLNSLFKKYFTNKEVIATPFGISISTKDYENDINYEELSTGEKKIIILFTLTIFSDNSIIIIDEPEASLSIVWQRELLPDIILNTKYKKLIVATQSPYIVSDNELMEYLICLPMENDNE